MCVLLPVWRAALRAHVLPRCLPRHADLSKIPTLPSFVRCCARAGTGCKALCSSSALCEAYDYELKGAVNNPCNLYGAKIKADTPGMDDGSDWSGGTATGGNTDVVQPTGAPSFMYRCSVKDKPLPGGGEPGDDALGRCALCGARIVHGMGRLRLSGGAFRRDFGNRALANQHGG